MAFKLPPCRSPNHPEGYPRDRMVVTDEREFGVMIACVPCRDVNRVVSAQYITLPKGWAQAKHFAEVQKLDRDKALMARLKRISYSMPS